MISIFQIIGNCKEKRSTTAEINFSTYPGYLESLAFFAFALLGISLSLVVIQAIQYQSGTVALGLQKLLRSMQQIYVAVTRINSKKVLIKLY